ncbi:MAG: hypothetical protein ABSF12_12285 [Bryobacteraceae bacterium]
MQAFLDEIRLFAPRIGSSRSILAHLALLAVFGFVTPRFKGLDFFDPQILGAYACLGLIFAGPATAQLFPEGISTSFQQAKARIFVGVLYGEVVALTLLAAGIATVYWSYRGHFVPTPDWESLARTALFGWGASAAAASLAAWVAVRFSRRVATLCLRLIFFALLILFYYRGQWLPEIGLAAAGGALAVAGVFLALLGRAVR